ncbi:MAG: hypothetical protein AB7P69_28800, partial [Candidatus Binatia bacterium]
LLQVEEDEAHELALALSALSLAECDGVRTELHPLLHEYARARLHNTPAHEQQLIVRHVAYFGQVIGGAYQRAVNEARGNAMDAALVLIDRERDNVELAQLRALADVFPDPHLAVALTVGLTAVWRLRDDTRLFDWLTRALSLATAAGAKLGQANVLQAIGDVQSFRDDKEAALASYDQALRLFTEVGAKLGQANVYLAQGQLQNDVSLLDRALGLYEKIGDRYSGARCKVFLGVLCLQNGDRERGVRLLVEARETCEQINFIQGV